MKILSVQLKSALYIPFKRREIPYFAQITPLSELGFDCYEKTIPPIQAQMKKDIKRIEQGELLPRDVDPNLKDENSNTILFNIILDENIEVFKKLISDKDFVSRIDLNVTDSHGENLFFYVANSFDERFIQLI